MQVDNKPNKKMTKALIDFMPLDEISRKILIKRAENAAKNVNKAKKQHASIQYIRFLLGKESYGISYDYAKEVMHHIVPTPVPSAPNYVAGVVNRRGSLLCVINLKKYFALPSAKQADNYVIVVSANNMTLGFLVDQIQGSDEYDSKTLDAAMAFENKIKANFIVGLHKGVTGIINIENILQEFQSLIKNKTKEL